MPQEQVGLSHAVPAVRQRDANQGATDCADPPNPLSWRDMTVIETLIRDIGLAARRLVRTPGFTVIAVTSLALGVGVNTLMFSFMNAVLLQPLPYPNSASTKAGLKLCPVEGAIHTPSPPKPTGRGCISCSPTCSTMRRDTVRRAASYASGPAEWARWSGSR